MGEINHCDLSVNTQLPAGIAGAPFCMERADAGIALFSPVR